MKIQKHILTTIVALTFVLSVALAACSPAAPPAAQARSSVDATQDAPVSPVVPMPAIDITAADDQGNTSIHPVGFQSNLTGSSELSDDEISGLLYMREEEKLAHDVYIALYEKWGLRIFQNIANSEQTHTDAVEHLLDAYGLADPAEGSAPGEFVNADLQALYDQLKAQGSQSLGDALKVGAAIEEIDILDLEERLAQTDKLDIRRVYENLLRGSRNHLRAFTSTLSRQTGETYQAQYMDSAAYQGIVSGATETGGNRYGNLPQSRGRGRGWSQMGTGMVR